MVDKGPARQVTPTPKNMQYWDDRWVRPQYHPPNKTSQILCCEIHPTKNLTIPHHTRLANSTYFTNCTRILVLKKTCLFWLCQLTSCTLNVGWWNASTNCHKSTHMFQRLICFEIWSQLPDVTRKCKFTHTWCSFSTWTLILRLTQPIVLPNCSPIFLTRPNTIN